MASNPAAITVTKYFDTASGQVDLAAPAAGQPVDHQVDGGRRVGSGRSK
jgi:hypothetical protein